ncbi:MAG: glycosyltransferase family 4 protein [Saprospiraceae bacterium]|nr:glycosyltransferase family 4 protein [Saprospiraceae bacterium]
MKILQVCKKFPHPAKDGESIAVTSLGRALHHSGCKLSLLAMNTAKHPFRGRNLPDALNFYDDVGMVDVDNRLRVWDAFLNLFSRDSYHISRFESQGFARRLQRVLREREYDIIQLETLFLVPYIPLIRKETGAPIALRAHNVEYEIWDRISQNAVSGPRKWYLQYLTKKLKRFEKASIGTCDVLLPITEKDLQTFQRLGYRGRAQVIPIGINTEEYRPDYSVFDRPPSMGFIGSLDWMPNREGLDWFLDSIWPRLLTSFPELRLHVAGRNTPASLRDSKRAGLVIHGEVPDARAFINQHSLLLVPLLSGSGMRVKILEAMALGKVVITTRLGLEGIEARDGRELMVADTASEFASKLQLFHRQGAQMRAMGQRARQFVETRYHSREIASRLRELYSSFTVGAL